MNQLRYGVIGLLALCVTLRVAAWLIAPVLPVIGAVFVMVMAYTWLFRRHRL